MSLQKSKTIKSLLPILALAFFLFQAVPAWGQQPYYTVPYDPANWMARLKDDTLISKISVPGTHESMSRYPVILIILGWHVSWQPVCNVLHLKDQLNYGIRLIDIRAHYNGGDTYRTTSIGIYHGGIPEKANFDPDVLDVCANFLRQHPTETIFMRVQQTGGYDYGSGHNHPRIADFWQDFQNSVSVDPNASMIWNGRYPDGSDPYSKIPTLGDVRGKIVIMQDFSSIELNCGQNAKTGIEAMTCLPTLGLRYSNYVPGPDNYLFNLQTSSKTDDENGGNYYTFAGPQIPQRFTEFIEDAEQAESSSKIVATTFGGGWWKHATPTQVALGYGPYEGMDQVLYDSSALAVRTLASSLGMVYMDFPRPALIQKIYELNFAKPVITLLGKPEMVLECGKDTFQDRGATVQDDFDANVRVDVSGTVDTKKPGTYIITYNATDCWGRKADPVTRTVIVRDTLPPKFNSLSATPNLLWPPNNKLVQVNFHANVVDACDPDPSLILSSVTSNEPDSGDVQNVPTGTQGPSILLRANRLGEDQDRIYQITYFARDHSGNQSTTRETTVTVPHDKGRR